MSANSKWELIRGLKG